MLLVPLATFYFSFFVVFKQQQDKLAWCGILAVIAVNIVIASYVLMAWNEDDQSGKSKSKSAQSKNKKARSSAGPLHQVEKTL